MNNQAPLSDPGVHFPPPIIFVGGLLVGWIVDRYLYALPLSRSSGEVLAFLGGLLVAIGGVLVGWGMVTFRRAQTAIIPNHSASQLVVGGPYRFTRNPMYTGLTIAYVGGAALLDSAWPLILLPIVLVVLFRLVISREEAYLSDAFSSEYTAYKARVRRWV